MKILLHPFSLFIRRTSRLGLRTNARILKGTLDEKRQAEYLQHRRFSTFDQIGEALEPEAKLHSERWNSTKALLGKVCHEIGHRQILKIQDVAAETRERQEEEEEEEEKEEEETKKKRKKKLVWDHCRRTDSFDYSGSVLRRTFIGTRLVSQQITYELLLFATSKLIRRHWIAFTGWFVVKRRISSSKVLSFHRIATDKFTGYLQFRFCNIEWLIRVNLTRQ